MQTSGVSRAVADRNDLVFGAGVLDLDAAVAVGANGGGSQIDPLAEEERGGGTMRGMRVMASMSVTLPCGPASVTEASLGRPPERP